VNRRIIPDHYAVYVDLGRLGMEAAVDPEQTRANVIDRLRRGDYPGSVRYVLHIVDGLAIDETDELIEAAEQMAREVEAA
jgi:transcriptional regulator with PAS, ATPase and Fis domain